MYHKTANRAKSFQTAPSFSGNSGGNVPNWAVGRFYASNPQNGGVIGITIESNGSVTVDFNGTVTYGTINDDRLTINSVTSKVKRHKNGIRATRNDNGERIDYIIQARLAVNSFNQKASGGVKYI